MCFKNVIFIISVLLLITPIKSHSQILIEEVSDYRVLVDSSLNLIRKKDPKKWKILENNVRRIDFNLGRFSTTEPPHTILISVDDMKLRSVPNIAAILVHESLHLYCFNENIKKSDPDEEIFCYQGELDFLTRIVDKNDQLIKNCKDKIDYYSKLKK